MQTLWRRSNDSAVPLRAHPATSGSLAIIRTLASALRRADAVSPQLGAA
jgi:hypothetical protein